MADQETKKWHIPVLNQTNHESWFRRYTLEFKAKEVLYVVDHVMQEHCVVSKASPLSVNNVTQYMEVLDINDSSKKVVLNIEKKKAYLKDDATAITLIFRALSDDD